MAAAYPFDAEPASFEDTVFEHGFDHILAACRSKAASWRCQRRDKDPVEIDREEEEFSYKNLPLVIGYWRLVIAH